MHSSKPKLGSGYFDSHCHLNDLPNLNSQLEQATLAGIQQFLVPGTEAKQWHQAHSVAQNTQSFLAVGTHPWFVENPQDEQEQLIGFLQQHTVAAIGEIGLDLYPAKTPRPAKEIQLAAFRLQLEVAHEYQLPVVVHSVKAHQEVIGLLKVWPDLNGVIHGFAGSLELAQQYIHLGFKLGIGPQLLRSTKLQRCVAQLSLAHLVLETDAPYLTQKSATDNPLLVLIEVAKQVARLTGLSLDDVREQTQRNTQALFNLA